jgi:DNA-binding CsgD family transcriptional regulator
MERLRAGDLQATLRFLQELYDLQELPAYQQRLVARLPTVVPCDVVTYCENNFRTKESRGFADRPESFDAEAARVYGRHAHESPLIRAYRRGRGSAVKYSDFLSRREFRATGLYNEFFRPRGIEYRIAKGLPGPPGLVTAVYLDRSSRDFSERERLLLNLLRPHFNQSYRNAAMVSALRDELALVEQGLASADGAIVLLAADGRPRGMTPLARRWLDEHFGAGATTDRRLPEAVRAWMARHAPSSGGELPPPLTPLVVEGEGSRLALRLLARATHRLLVLQRRPRGRPSLESLGLSGREAEVMAWVAEGKTNAETATILGLSRRTVDKHLEHVFAKLGVETRMAAANRVRAALAASE